MPEVATERRIAMRRVFAAPRELVWREVRAPERLVWADGDRLATVTLTALAERATRVDLVTTIVGSAALRRQAMAGMTSAWDRLADHLTDHHPPRSPR